MIYTNTHKRIRSIICLVGRINYQHGALEPTCGALKPGALQLGGAQTGYHIFREKVESKNPSFVDYERSSDPEII